MTHRFFIVLLLVILGTFLQVMVGSASGIWINFALTALITAAFFINSIELVSLVLLSIFILDWQPLFSFEILVFGLLPCVVFFMHKFFPLKPWLMNFISICAGLLIFDLMFGARLFFTEPHVLLWDVALSLIFGGVAFRCLCQQKPQMIS